MADKDKKTTGTEAAEETEAFAGKDRYAREVFEWVQTFCQALFAVVILFTFVFRFVTVDGHSMDYTLAHGDRLIISDINYTPERGDIVVVHDLETETMNYDASTGDYGMMQAFRGPIIKRIIATEGEKVVIDYDNWTITITETDGDVIVLDEPYVNYMSGAGRRPDIFFYPSSIGHLEEHIVAEGCVFVCGDNRNNSLDSRYVGDIDARKILGKVLFRVFPNPGFMGSAEY